MADIDLEISENPLLDDALEQLDGDWDTCTLLDFTFAGVADRDLVFVLGARLAMEILDNGENVILGKGDDDHFNRNELGRMLRYYFGEFPDMKVVFTKRGAADEEVTEKVEPVVPAKEALGEVPEAVDEQIGAVVEGTGIVAKLRRLFHVS